MNKKENLKYRSTHKAIIDEVLALLKEKDLNHISVAEVCRRVGVNRSTFYEHFVDIPDVLDKVAVQVNANISQIIPQNKPAQEDFQRLFCHVRENRAFYTIYFKQGLPLSVQSKLFPPEPPHPDTEVMRERGIKTTEQLEYHHAMFQAALNAMLKRWLERDCAETPEDLWELLLSTFV